MTIQEWGALGEMIGGIAIIVSLLYVGAQIRHNTKATKSATSQAFVQIHGEITLELARSPEFREIYWRGLGGLSNLKADESAAFGGWCIQTFRAWESFFFQWNDGVFDDHIWHGWNKQFGDLLGYPGIQEWWEVRHHQFSENFREFVNSIIANAESKPLYSKDEGTH